MMTLNMDSLVEVAHAYLHGAKKGDALLNVSSTLAMVVCLSACATVPSRPPPPRPVARSSIDALLVHAAELQLSDAQQAQLRDFDDVREVRAKELIRELRERRAAQFAPDDEPRGGDMGGRRKHQGGGGHNVPRIPAVDAQLDELDTQAYVSAEAVLTEPQREPARKFASAYREALFDWRRATHGKAE